MLIASSICCLMRCNRHRSRWWATVRADFYDPLISHQKIQALLPTQQVLLGSMPRAELERTIVEPAKMVGLAFDPPRLVSRNPRRSGRG